MNIELQPRQAIADLKETINNKLYGRVKKKWLMITIIVAVFLIVLIFGGAALAYEVKYQDKFFPGSRIGNVSLEGLTKIEAKNLLDQITPKIEESEIKIIYEKDGVSRIKMTSAINSLNDPDLSRELLKFHNQETVDEAFAVGRSQNWWHNLTAQINLLYRGYDFDAKYSLDENILRKTISQEFSELEKVAKNAQPEITWNGESYAIELQSEQAGVAIDYQDALEEINSNLKKLENNPIQIREKANYPIITLTEISGYKYLIDQVLSTSTPTLKYENRKWEISKLDWSKMLEFQRNQEDEMAVGINSDQFSLFLDQEIAKAINVEAKDAKVEMKDGKIADFQTHQEGKKINLEKTHSALNQVIGQGTKEVEIAIDLIKPDITTDQVNDMGIKEVIGVGQSNFAGSPTNRRHNIATGANKLHGVLIKPGEEFSLIKTLGVIDAASGYRQELVIKGNKTTPEFGGGLCQIGTTTFRAALASGLPITERQSHSYSVTYYLENGLPGIDATIYDPKPDFKFVNDTGNYILIQTKISGNDLYFYFWGAKDGRKAERTKPKTWSWTSPPPTKYVETLELKPGEQKCTEVSHKGVSASFDYIVTYQNGEVKKNTFTSVYKPWQAVCLIGVEKLSEESNGDTASSTEEILVP